MNQWFDQGALASKVSSPKSGAKKVIKPNTTIFGKKQPKYKENLRLNIQQKYMQKLEEQDNKYSKMINDLKLDYTEQIEELHHALSIASNAVVGSQNDTVVKVRELYDIIFEKDIKIQELEQKIEDFEDEFRK